MVQIVVFSFGKVYFCSENSFEKMLKRRIEDTLREWKDTPEHLPLVIMGLRQCGKTFIVRKFAEENYKYVYYMNFTKQPKRIGAFLGSKEVDAILLELSAQIKGANFVPGQTCFIFDEIQDCPDARTSLKFFKEDGRFDVIATGSLLGVQGYGEKKKKLKRKREDDIKLGKNSVPVGYEDIVQMYPLDFEEFAWANGVGSIVIDALRNCFEKKKEVDTPIHNRMMALFELYLIVGGMPAAVSTYLETKNLRTVADEQNAIVQLYKRDISKYDEGDRLYLNDIFDLIPSELNAKNKRFIMKKLNEKARFDKCYESFLWLKNAGVALPVNVVEELRAPLLFSKSQNLFKLFSNDVGLLAAQYGNEIQLEILKHEVDINFGSIYENVAAQELTAHGYTLYYYNSKKFGELDFVIEDADKVLPIEIKSGKDYYRHNAMDNILRHESFNMERGYVFCNGNIEVQGKITYFPIYMIMFVQKKTLPSEIIFDTDFSDLNKMV